MLRSDYRLVLPVILAAIGMAALLLHLIRRRRRSVDQQTIRPPEELRSELRDILMGPTGTQPEQRRKTQMLLGDILVKKQRLIGPDQLATALVRQRRTKQRLGEVLVEMGLITKEQLDAALHEQRYPRDPWGNPEG